MIKAVFLIIVCGIIVGFGLGYSACASDNGLHYNDWHLNCFAYLLGIIIPAIIVYLIMTLYEMRKK